VVTDRRRLVKRPSHRKGQGSNVHCARPLKAVGGDTPEAGRCGWVGGTRRKPIPGGSWAPSMAPNGPANPPTPTRPHMAGAHGNVSIALVHGGRWLHSPLVTVESEPWGRGRPERGGTVGRHGWRSRAYTDVLAACPATLWPDSPRAESNSPLKLTLRTPQTDRGRAHTPTSSPASAPAPRGTGCRGRCTASRAGARRSG